MKKRFVTLLFILILLTMLVSCNGGSVGPAGPPGPIGPQGPPGSDADLSEVLSSIQSLEENTVALFQVDIGMSDRINALEDGGSAFTREVDVVIYSGSGPMNLDAIKDVQGLIKGDTFSCEFKVDNGGRIDEGAYMCVPVSDGQPSGYARFFDGTGRISGGVGSHGRTVGCISEWQRPPGVGNKWGVRVECPNYNPFTGESLMGGIQRIGKRFPFTANTDDHWRVTITIP